jgi:hypothetical protein
MQSEKLKVGVEGFNVVVDVRVPQTAAECLALARNSEEYLVSKFTRGWRIDNQEDSGARDLVAARIAGKSKTALSDESFVKALTADVQKVVNEYNPLEPSQRGRPRGPTKVTLTAAEMTAIQKNPAKLAEIMAAKGLKVEVE